MLSVLVDFEVDTGGGLSAGAIAGIVVGSCAVVVLLLFVLWRMGYLGGKNVEDKGDIVICIVICALLVLSLSILL